MAIYVTNLVTLIGIAIAIDYSLLVVYRFREELLGGADEREALRTTMRTAGRAVLFSGATVAIGLAMLVLIPLPFIRSMGVGGLLIPLVSISAALTLLPALLAIFGARLLRLRVPLIGLRPEREGGAWARIAETIMRRPGARRRHHRRLPDPLRPAGAVPLADPGIEPQPARHRPPRCRASSCSSARSARARSRRSSPWSTAGAPGGIRADGARHRAGSWRRCAPTPR